MLLEIMQLAQQRQNKIVKPLDQMSSINLY